MSELRWNALRQEWVSVATERQARTFLPPRDLCPLDPTTPGGPLTEAPGPYHIAILQNRFPSFTPDAPPAIRGSPLQPARPAAGVCEVVLYTPDHDATIGSLPLRRLEQLVSVWQDRYRRLGALPGVDYVYIFENRGEAIGVTLSHPHGQIYGYPMIPPVAGIELAAGAQYRAETGRCLQCDLVSEERAGARLVFENGDFAVYCPFAARYPYEAHIAAREHLASLDEFGAGEIQQLAGALGGLVRAYDALYGFTLPYIMAMHQAPTDGGAHSDAHFHIELYPVNRTRDKLKYLAGSEAGAGVFVTDVLPEDAAAQLRAGWPEDWP